MPHSGGIVRAYRHRRVVERREQIGPDIIDFCGGLLEGVDHILDVRAIQLQKTPFHRLRRQNLLADADGGGGTAHHIHDQFQKALHIVV